MTRWNLRLDEWGPARFLNICLQAENRPILVVCLAALAFLVWKAAFLVYPDLSFTYPFITYDGFQWILDADLFRGRDVTGAYRNPGLPIVIAVLGRFGATRLLPVLTTALLAVSFVYLIVLLRDHYTPIVVAIAVLLLFFNFTIQTIYDYVLADQWAVTFQIIAIYHLGRAKHDQRHLVAFAVWAAVSFNFQYAIAFVAPAFVYYYFAELRPAAPSPTAIDRVAMLAAATGALLVLPSFLYRWKEFGNPFYSHVTQFPLVNVHFFGIPYYAVNFLSFFGIPTAALIAFGFVTAVARREFIGSMNLGMVCWAIFWVFLYSWLDSRFIVYLLPFAAFALAEGLTRVQRSSLWPRGRHPAARTVAACGVLTLSLLYGLFDRGSPFASNRLPVSPQNVLVFEMVPITHWEANATIDVAGWKLENVTDRIPGIDFLRRYYPIHRDGVSLPAAEEERELRRMGAVAEGQLGPRYRIAACGNVPDDYYSRMRREIALHRRLVRCAEPADARLYLTADSSDDAPLIFAGRTYLLKRAVAPPRRSHQ